MDNRKLIFFTDDDRDDLDIMEEICNSLGQHFQSFQNGAGLVLQIKSTDKKPDVVFLDIEMPRTDGYEIIKEIRSFEEFSNIPIVIHTGNYDERCIEKCFKLGADFFIQKKFDFKEVKNSIEYAINRDWLSHKPLRDNFVYGIYQ